MTTEVSWDYGTALMVERGYTPSDFLGRFVQWIDRGDVVLIFENADLGHPDLGDVMAMPWTETARPDMPSDGPLPPHAPDSSRGLGWRYVTKYVIRSRPLGDPA